MGPNLIVVLPPGFDQDLGLVTTSKPLQAETLIPEFIVEGFVGGILPRFARVDVGGIDIGVGGPFQDRARDEFWPIVRPQITRHAVGADQARQNVDHMARTKTAGNLNRQTFPRPFVHDR